MTISTIKTIDLEEAYSIAAQLGDSMIRTETNAVTVFSGEHSEHGSIHIVITPYGQSLMLPNAIAVEAPVATHAVAL